MKKYDVVDVKQGQYSSLFTRIMIESIICSMILISIFLLSNTNHELISKIDACLRETIQWQTFYEAFIVLKNML